MLPLKQPLGLLFHVSVNFVFSLNFIFWPCPEACETLVPQSGI